jgi:nickel/cobalt transporter (NicO) family protein
VASQGAPVTLPDLYQALAQAIAGAPSSVAVALLVSLVLGALHAVSPGHGKTLVVASLLGTRGSLGRAVALAVTVAITHTAAILLLATVVLSVNDVLLPQRVTPYISLVAALLVVLFGADLVRRTWQSQATAADGTEPHHVHPHLARSGPTIDLSRGYLLSIGVLGGLVPNGTALLVLLLAITLNKLTVGLLLVATFGVGIAAVMLAVGAAAVLLRRWGVRLGPGHERLARLVGWLPVASGIVVIVVGLALTVRGLLTL